MRKIISLILIMLITMSSFNNLQTVQNVFAESDYNEGSPAVEETPLASSDNINIKSEDLETPIEEELIGDEFGSESIFDKVLRRNKEFLKPSVQPSDRTKAFVDEFSSEMKQITAYFYPELSQYLTINEKLESTNWDENEVVNLILSLNQTSRKTLYRYVPMAEDFIDYYKNHTKYLNEHKPMLTLADEEVYKSEVHEQLSKQSQADNTLKNKKNVVTNTFANSSANQNYTVTESKNTYNYKVNTDDLVDSVYRTANRSVVDLEVKGKPDLDIVLKRSYNSLNSKLLKPNLKIGASMSSKFYEQNGGNEAVPLEKDDRVAYIAAGWSLNIPTMEKSDIKAEIVNTHESSSCYSNTPQPCYQDGYSYKEMTTPYEKTVFTLERGDSYEFHDLTIFNYPYKNVVLSKEPYTENGVSKNYFILKLNNELKYKFNDQGNIISKSNGTGDQVSYVFNEDVASNNYNIVITDSYQRNITIFRDSNNVISGIKAQEDSEKVKQIIYNTTQEKAPITFRKWTTNGYQNVTEDVVYWNLNSVYDNSMPNAPLKLEQYTYYGIDSTKLADFNFNVYTPLNGFYSNSAGELLNISYNNFYNCSGWSDNTCFEARSIQKNNILTSGEVPYLLLKDIQYYNGLTARFSYASYDSSWRESTSLMNQGQVARLYQDKYALEYVSYHPVQSLDYIYTEDSKPIIISNYYSNVHNDHGWQVDEFWKSNKQDIARLRNSSRFGDKQTILKKVTAADGKKEVSSSHYYLNSSRFLMDYSMISNAPNGNELYQYGYKIKDQSNISYEIYNNDYTQYEYDFGQLQPKKKSTFVANNSINDINSLMNPGSITTISEKVSNLYTYDDWGNILTQSDNLGNMAVMQYNGPNHKISKSVYTEQGGDIQKTEEYRYYPDTTADINNRNQLWITAETYSYKNSSNVMKSDSKTTEYTQYDAIHKAPTRIKTNLIGEQFGLGNNDTEINLVYTDKGNVKYETTKVKLKEGANTQDLTLGYEYYWNGNIKKTTYPDGSSFFDTFDALNRLVSRKSDDGKGIITKVNYRYNDSARQVSIIMPDGEIHDAFYTPFGTLTKQQRTINGSTRTININEVPDGVMIKKTMPYGDSNQKKELVYDTNGRVVKETNAIGENTTYLYSNVVRLSNNSVLPQDTVEKTLSDGKKEISLYDSNRRLTKLVEKTPNGLKQRTTSYIYTPTGKISSEKIEDKDGNTHITKYRYDGNGNLIYILSSAGEETRYTYNSLGQVIDVYLNDILQKHNTYNEVGWKLSEKNNNNLKETYEYGVDGNLKRIFDRIGQIHNYSYTYDNQKERVSITKNGAELYWQEFQYDPTTRSLTKSLNSENNIITYHYDQWKRVDKQNVAGVSYTLGYDSFDRMNSITYPDGKIVSYVFDNLSRINTVSYPDMGTVTNVNVTSSDFNSIRTTFPESLEQLTVTDAFGEVSSNRINNNSTTNFIELYSYDGFGNIDKINGNGLNVDYKYDVLNRIVDENPTSSTLKKYTYNANGDRATSKDSEEFDLLMESKKYTYNSLNLLKTYSDSNDSASYTYYSDGLRATKTVNGIFTRYVYLNEKVIDELDENGNSKARNIQGSKLLFRKDNVNSRAGYYFYNAHGDIVKIIDADGSKATLKSYNYDIWGNLTYEDSNQSKSFDNPYKYSGELLDDESGLIYLKARYYDPSIGRFITEDTYDGRIDNPLTQNLYTYVHNNPLIYNDSTGHKAWLIHGTFSNGDTWTPDFVKYVENLFQETSEKLEWSGGNSNGARSEAAEDFVSRVYEWHKENPDDPIRLIGHSHGGNVAIMLTNLLEEKGMKVENLITIATPVRGYSLKTSVGEHMQVYNSVDAVQENGGSVWMLGQTTRRTFPGAKNVEVGKKDVGVKGSKSIEAHSRMHSNVNVWKKYIEPRLKLKK